MKYIKITNLTDDVSRLKLEKIGFSTKRDDSNTIGQFGSGIKFAPIAAVRKGMEFIFAGSDKNGKYTLEYIAKEEDGINSIFYKYDDYEKPSSFTIDAGVLSWQDDFQIYREVVANAIDEHKITGNPWSVDVVDVDEINPVDGEFSVYITATEEMLDIHNNFDKYFTINRVSLYENDYYKLYAPIDDMFRVYCKGVLVYTGEKLTASGNVVKGFFDYDLSTIELNEERNPKHTASIGFSILELFASVDDPWVANEILLSIFNTKNDELKNYFETSAIADYYYGISWSASECLKVAFEDKYPKTVMVPDKDLSHNLITSIRSMGYEYITIYHNGFYNFLKRIGVASYENILGNFFSHDVTMDYQDFPVLSKALEIVNTVLPETSEIKDNLGIYFDDSDSLTVAITTSSSLGFNDNPRKRILFNRYFAENLNMKEMIATIVHEWDHYRTGFVDGDDQGRAFRNVADTTIAELIYELWKYKRKEQAS